MEDYKERMIEEYKFVKEKYDKLHKMLIKQKAGTLGFELTCPVELLQDQMNVMSQYLYILEIRAELEGIGDEIN